MPQQRWSDKRERQYQHIKGSQRERGVGEERAKEIAARTVNKDRAQADESRQASKTSLEGSSPRGEEACDRAGRVHVARPRRNCTRWPGTATSRAGRR